MASAIPPILSGFLEHSLGSGYIAYSDDIGRSSHVQIFRPSHSPDNPEVNHSRHKGIVLKAPRNAAASRTSARESRVLKIIAKIFPLAIRYLHLAIDGKETFPASEYSIRIPMVIDFHATDVKISNMHLREFLPGKNAAVIFPGLSFDQKLGLVYVLAEALFALHSVTVPVSLIKKLEEANDDHIDSPKMFSGILSCHEWLQYNLEEILVPRLHNLLSRSNDQQSTIATGSRSKHLAIQQALSDIAVMKAYADKPGTDPYWSSEPNKRLVLLHEDFMLPNILLSQTMAQGIPVGKKTDGPEKGRSHTQAHYYVSGLVDWGGCSMGDRRYDLSACVWSIEFNANLCGLDDIQAYELTDVFLKRYNQMVRNTLCFSDITHDDLRPWKALYEFYRHVHC